MGFTFACPACRQDIQAREDMEGLHGRCPHCSATFTIPAMRGSVRRERPAEGDGDYEPRRLGRDDDGPGLQLAPGWIGVRNGLLLVRVSTIIAIFVALGMILFIALAQGIVPFQERNRNREMILGTLLIMGTLVALAAAILALVGQCMCCAIPESGPKGLAIGSVICVVLTLLLGAAVIMGGGITFRRGPFVSV